MTTREDQLEGLLYAAFHVLDLYGKATSEEEFIEAKSYRLPVYFAIKEALDLP